MFTPLLSAEDFYLYGTVDNLGPVTIYIQSNDRDFSGWFLRADEKNRRPLSGREQEEGLWVLEEAVGLLEGGILLEGRWTDEVWSGEWRTVEESRSFHFRESFSVAEIYYGRSPQLSYRVQIPHFNNEELSSWNRDLRGRQIEQMGQFLRQFDRYGDNHFPWNSQSTLSCSFATDHWISLLSEIVEFTGGAHGNLFLNSLALMRDERGQWKELTLSDLVEGSEGLDKIAEAVRLDLEEQGASWVDRDEWERNGSSDLLDDFTITPMGLTFYFEPYTAGPYAEGVFEVFLPWIKGDFWSARVSSFRSVQGHDQDS